VEYCASRGNSKERSDFITKHKSPITNQTGQKDILLLKNFKEETLKQRKQFSTVFQQQYLHSMYSYSLFSSLFISFP
jgi:hypothetical protein